MSKTEVLSPKNLAGIRFFMSCGVGSVGLILTIALGIIQGLQTIPEMAVFGFELVLLASICAALLKYFKERYKSKYETLAVKLLGKTK